MIADDVRVSAARAMVRDHGLSMIADDVRVPAARAMVRDHGLFMITEGSWGGGCGATVAVARSHVLARPFPVTKER
jgi:hypothetical protein